MAETASKKTSSEEAKAPRNRSPNFPADSLDVALGWAEKIHTTYKRFPVPVSTLHKNWGIKEHGSAGNQRIAALRAFGLLDLSGSGKDRRAAISEAGERIVRKAPNRDDLLKIAALTPRIFRELWKRYESDGIPPDDLIENYLVWERDEGDFTEEAAKIAVANFKKSIAFAKVVSGDIINEAETGDGADNEVKGSLDGDHKPSDDGSRLRRVKRETTVPIRSREEVFTVPEGGDIILQFPAQFSPATFADFKTWIEFTVRKMSRYVREPQTESTENGE